MAESDTPEIEQRDRPLGLARERLVVHLGRRGVLTEPQQGHPVLVIHLGVPLVEDDGALQRFAHSDERAGIAERHQEAAGHPRVCGRRILLQRGVDGGFTTPQHTVGRQTGVRPSPVEKQRVSQRDACQSRRVAGVQAGGRLILLDRAAHRARCALRELVVPAQKVVVGTRVGGGAGRERGLLGGGEGAAERGRHRARRLRLDRLQCAVTPIVLCAPDVHAGRRPRELHANV